MRIFFCCLFFLAFSGCSKLNESNALGIHQSQVYFIESYNKIKKNIYKSDFDGKYFIDQNIKLRKIDSFILDKVSYIEVDVTYLDKYNDLFISYGVVEGDELSRFQVFNNSLLSFSFYAEELMKQNSKITFWVDLKNLNTHNAREIIEILEKYKGIKFFIETQDLNVAKILKENKMNGFLIWIDPNRIFNEEYQDEIKKLSPIAISQHYKYLEKIKDNFPTFKLYTWTNHIEYDPIGSKKMRDVLDNADLVLVNYEIIFGMYNE